jgi:protein-S-isoprenylcysteine O-methyltransferase Ste14
MVTVGNFFFRYRDFLFPAVFVLLALGLPPKLLGGSAGIDWLANGIGLAVAISGQALRVAVIGLAYIKRGGKNKQIYADSLVQDGFFAHSRNPLYLGNILVLAGLIIVHGAPGMVAIGLLFFLFAYTAIVLAEEDYLRKQFGQAYEDYCRRVPRFIPRFQGLGETMRGMTFDWKRVLRKEYGSTFTWVTTALALLGWEIGANLGWEAAKPRVAVLLGLWIPVILAYAAVRFLKKKRRLGTD